MNYNKFSNYFGLVADYKFPNFIQKAINKWYVSKFKIDMSEFNEATSYKSLNELFTRNLIKDREFDTDENTIISPSDGLCLECGKVVDNQAISVKNHTYKVDELLLDCHLQSELNYANIYLAPKDYHHYHAPCDMEILEALYIPGELFSVAKSWLMKVDNLYAKNERVVLKCRARNNIFIWLVFVGAWNVGKMKFSFDERIKTNANLGKNLYRYQNLHIKKGQRLGNFELGSTILIFTQNGIELNLKADDELKFGQSIGKIK